MLTKLSIQDKRMMELMEWAMSNDLATSEGEYWEKIGFARTSISKVRKGEQSFTVAQIIKACKLTGASADWILGLDKTMFRLNGKISVVTQLKQVLAQLEKGKH